MIKAWDVSREIISHPDNLGVSLFINNYAMNFLMHWHTENEIIMPIEDIYTVEIDNKTYVLNPGDILVIPSGEIHEITAPPTGKRIITLFDNSLFNDLYGMDSIKNNFYPCAILRADKTNSDHQQLVGILEQIAEEYMHHDVLYEASIYSLLIKFFVLVGRSCITSDKSCHAARNNKQHAHMEKLVSICKYINDHCTENITLDDLAAIAGFSKYHFSRIFHEFSGMSYYDYLMKRRILYAESLLCDPTLSILEIAIQSGYHSVSSFNRNFRKIKNCTPKEYRQIHIESSS